MQVRDVQVSLLSADRSVALTFATTTGDVNVLRARVRRIAAQYAARPDRRRLFWHWSGNPAQKVDAGPAGSSAPPPGLETEVEPVKGGARLWLAPRSLEGLRAVRQHARTHRDRYHAGQCWRWTHTS